MSRLIGAHVSASGGVDKAPARAAQIGCNALQIFSGSPRTWGMRPASDYDRQAYLDEFTAAGMEAGIIHAMYLINLASDKPEQVKKSHQALVNDLTIAAHLDIDGVVVHVGSHQGRGYEAMKEQMIGEIKSILKETPDGGIFLIENSAGQKGKIASDFQEIKEMFEAVNSDRLGWCFDTCHAHAAGLDLAKVVDTMESMGILKQLKCIHVNDSRDPFGSGRDRHENIGDGNIDKAALKTFLTDKRISHIPLILEVPGIDKKGPDKENVDRLKEIVEGNGI